MLTEKTIKGYTSGQRTQKEDMKGKKVHTTDKDLSHVFQIDNK